MVKLSHLVVGCGCRKLMTRSKKTILFVSKLFLKNFKYKLFIQIFSSKFTKIKASFLSTLI